MNPTNPPSRVSSRFAALCLFAVGCAAALAQGVSASQTPASSKVSVPNVIGQTTANASHLVGVAGLRVQTGPGRATSDKSQDGKVAAQSPAGGQTVAKGATVTLTPYTYQAPAQAVVPNLVGLTVAGADSALGAAGFKAQNGAAKTTTDKTQDGKVAAQSPAGGQTVAKGSTVTLTPFAYQAPAQVSVPNVVGQTVAGAGQALGAAGFKAQNGAAKPTTDKTQDGKVAAQSPAAGQAAAKGATVTLTPFAYQAPAQAIVPNLVGQTVAGADQALVAAGFKAQSGATKTTADKTQDGKVAAQSPAAGQTVAKGTTVTLTAYKYAKAPTILTVSGGQTRGHGVNGTLNPGRFTIPAGSVGTITGVTCNGDSLYLNGPAGGTFQPATSAIGRSLPAGSYEFYPNLRAGQDQAGASITYSYP